MSAASAWKSSSVEQLLLRRERRVDDEQVVGGHGIFVEQHVMRAANIADEQVGLVVAERIGALRRRRLGSEGGRDAHDEARARVLDHFGLRGDSAPARPLASARAVCGLDDSRAYTDSRSVSAGAARTTCLR